MDEIKCRICGNSSNNAKLKLNATMYGTKGLFSYFICKECGCLQIEREMDNIGDYYDASQYYSFNMDRRKLKNELLYRQMLHQIGKKNLPGGLVGVLYPVNYNFLNLVKKEDAILDVGCGDGEFLRWLLQAGFTNVMGIDPFAEKDYYLENQLLVAKGDVREYQFEKKFNLIVLLHSLEHVFDQREHIQSLERNLLPGGYMVFQLPVFSTYYWEKYGNCLYTLDPPRHFYLHTKRSLMILMDSLGYEMVDYSTEIDVGIPSMAKNIEKGETEKNNGCGFVSGTISALKSWKLRKELKKNQDGAIATAIFRKKNR